MRWWFDFSKLSPKQRSIVDAIRNNPDQTHWIQGFAGTGKTLILLHIMEQIAAAYPNASLCYITYTHALVALVRTTPGYEKISRQADIQTYYRFIGRNKRYDFVFLDEVQDTEQGKLEKIKSLAKHLYVAGDPDQQIYGDCVGADDILKILQPQKHELLQVYRLTARLCKVALSIMPEARLADGLMAAANPNATITLMQADSKQDEAAWVWTEARDRARPGEPSVILFPHHHEIYNFACLFAKSINQPAPPKPAYNDGKRDYGPFNQHLQGLNIPAMYLGNQFGSLRESDHHPLVYLMTYPSAKGLDFKNVFIPFLTADANLSVPERLLTNPGLDRRLLFVAVTRSRENLFLSYSGQNHHPYLSDLPADGVNRTNLASFNTPPGEQEEFF
jgi:superfamily I DNA/RNA helicase